MVLFNIGKNHENDINQTKARSMNKGCGSITRAGHGENYVCGELCYSEIYICQTCIIKQQKEEIGKLTTNNDFNYQQIQYKFEAWLRGYWKGIPKDVKRPDFKEASIQYAECRKTLDQEFLKEFGIKR